MNKFSTEFVTTVLTSLKYRPWIRRFTCAVIGVVAFHFAMAQEATFRETFDATAAGEVPEGWKLYTLGGTHGNNWARSTYGFFGPKVMSGGSEYAFDGQIDEDWLVTPQITPIDGDHLVFDAGQEMVWDDLGSTFHVRISTTSSNRPDFTTTLATWTESEFLGYLYDQRITLDLSAYAGMPIYIAFVHENPVTGESEDPNVLPPTEMFYLDNVEVRPLRTLDYSAGEIFSKPSHVIRVAQSKTSVILGIVVRASGDNGTANITSLSFTTGNTSPLVRIKEATLYATYGDSFIGTDEETGTVWADVFGSVSDPVAEFSIQGDLALEHGDNYFWLMYTLEANEGDLTYPYPVVDATFESVVVNETSRDATISTLAGTQSVVPPQPVNDDYASAFEITPSLEIKRYGSYNHRATYESELERLAYCATPIYATAMDGSNSVWWKFTAPGSGFVTIDLSTCNFNTLLLVQDDSYQQLACNKDIDESALVFQSKIAEFEVEAKKEYYIRVSGEAAYPGDPNAASGVIHMDFSFATPLSVDEGKPNILHALYPNPTQGALFADLVVERPGEVVVDVVDLVGRVVSSWHADHLEPGRHERMRIDIPSLPQGSFVVRIRGSKERGQKLVVLGN